MQSSTVVYYLNIKLF